MNSCVVSITIFQGYPYGNAQETLNAGGTYTYSCQHGPSECAGNMYEACAIEHYGNNSATTGQPKWWPFFYCLEKSGQAGVASVAQNCATSTGLNWSTISTCAGSNPPQGSPTDGNPFMHTIAVSTNNLVPPHQWTPWVVVNGSPLSQTQINSSLINIICSKYTGTKPSCCPATEEHTNTTLSFRD